MLRNVSLNNVNGVHLLGDMVAAKRPCAKSAISRGISAQTAEHPCAREVFAIDDAVCCFMGWGNTWNIVNSRFGRRSMLRLYG